MINFVAVDVTGQFQLIFNTINSIYKFLMSLEFTAFGFTFSYLGFLFSFIFLVILIKFLKFGFESGASSYISYKKKENAHDKKVEQNGGSKWI